jgi:hypothetical protein
LGNSDNVTPFPIGLGSVKLTFAPFIRIRPVRTDRYLNSELPMLTKTISGRHRKPSQTSAIAARSAVSAGFAVAAVLAGGAAASAATTTATPAVASVTPNGAPPPALAFPCTGYPIDAFTTCAGTGQVPGRGNPGDASGADTPNLGSGGGGGK